MSSVPLVSLRRSTEDSDQRRSTSSDTKKLLPPLKTIAAANGAGSFQRQIPITARPNTVRFAPKYGYCSPSWWRHLYLSLMSERDRRIWLRSTKMRMEEVLTSRNHLTMMGLLTLYSLLGDQIRLGALPKSYDPCFRGWNTILFFIFLIEILAMSFAVDGYFFHPSAAGGGATTTTAPGPFSPRSPISLRSPPSSPTPLADNREGLAAGPCWHIKSRFMLHKPPSFLFWLDLLATIILLFDPTFDNYLMVLRSSNASQTMMTAKVTRLSFKAVRVIRILRALSFLRLLKYNDATEDSNRGSNSTQQQQLQTTAPRSLTARHNSIKTGRQGGGSFALSSSSSYASHSTTQELSPPQQSRLSTVIIDGVHRKIILGGILLVVVAPLLSYSSTDTTWDFSLQVLQEVVQSGPNWAVGEVVELIAGTVRDRVNWLEVNGVTYIDQSSALERLRSGEIAVYTSGTAKAIQDIKIESKLWAWEGMLLTLIILAIFVGLSVLMHADLTRLVFTPLNQMIDLVDRISSNPLAPIPEAELATSSPHHRGQGLEPTLLLQTIGKIGALVKIGLGEAGADIIARSLQEAGNSTKLSLKMAGKLTTSLFVFCDIRNFTDTTECLQEEVMVFVNKIAALLHTITVQCGGAPNKNVGDAFLLVWKIMDHEDDDDEEEDDELQQLSPEQRTSRALMNADANYATKQSAGQALYCVLKFALEMARWQHYICSFSAGAAQRLYARMPTYKVNIGFGLHVGWAVEGPIGSEQKIDVSYISPTVTLSEFLQDLTKDYGCTVLVSDVLYHLLPPQARYNCRQLDCVRRQGRDPMGIYTYDCDPDTIMAPSMNPKSNAFRGSVIQIAGSDASPMPASHSSSPNGGRAGLLKVQLPASPGKSSTNVSSPHPFRSPRNNNIINNNYNNNNSSSSNGNPRYQPGPGGAGSSPSTAFRDPSKVVVQPYTDAVWDSDPDLQYIRTKLHPNFRATWNYAMSSYLAGEWSSAKQGFETTLDMSQGRDGPSKKLLDILKGNNYKAPADWPGYRDILR